MPRQLPPLNALRAFEAAARSESFTRAAEELCVTQGAVSHQVKALEATLGIKLFNRERQRLVITDAGREYLGVVRDALDRIAAGTERVLQRQNSGVLTVSTSPDFAAKWLVNRLGRFAEAHPGIDLRVSATMHHIDFVREEVDVAVRHGVEPRDVVVFEVIVPRSRLRRHSRGVWHTAAVIPPNCILSTNGLRLVG